MSGRIFPFRMYISMDRDLAVEREVITTSLTEVPLDVGWRINFSPASNDPLEPDMIQSSDLYLLLMGNDIRAPVGQEYFIARKLGLGPVLLLKMGVNRTQAAQDFVRFLAVKEQWRSFSSLDELRFILLDRVTSRLVEKADELRLSKAELQMLAAWHSEFSEKEGRSAIALRKGAGESSVILSLERFYPTEGIVPDRDSDQAEDQQKGDQSLPSK